MPKQQKQQLVEGIEAGLKAIVVRQISFVSLKSLLSFET